MATVGVPLPTASGIVLRGSKEYPQRLEHLCDPPDRLYVRGSMPLPPDRMIAIVGTRRATEYGRRMALDIAFGIASAGWIVVSGVARGIDAAAHRGALASGATTIGVLGCGLGHVYPRNHRELYAAIERSGLLVTEFSHPTGPRKHHFPRRNRIIAALSRAVVVVQAGHTSGALITAGMALDLGREVLAVPGQADQETSKGVNRLLRDGAGLATCAGDVLAALGEDRPGARAVGPTRGETSRSRIESGVDPGRAESPQERLKQRLRDGPAPVDELAEAAGLRVAATMAALTRLELSGIVRAVPGQRFELTPGS